MKDYREKDSQEAKIYLGFKSGIIEFNPYNIKQKIHYLDWNLIYLRWIVDLPNGELLCCGKKISRRNIGYSKARRVFILFIINSRTLKIIREIPCKYHVNGYNGIYYNNFIYLFGSYSLFSLNLVQEKWKEVAPLPKNSSDCYCIPFKRSILLCGTKHSDVHKYDIDIESYSTLGLSLGTYNTKLLLFHNEVVYLIELKGFIYESEVENEYCWAQVGEGSIYESVQQIYWVSNNASIFIGTYSIDGDISNYYDFQLSHKRLIHMCEESEESHN